ncbi:WRKY Transcription Factor [Dionaea muscipula]
MAFLSPADPLVFAATTKYPPPPPPYPPHHHHSHHRHHHHPHPQQHVGSLKSLIPILPSTSALTAEAAGHPTGPTTPFGALTQTLHIITSSSSSSSTHYQNPSRDLSSSSPSPSAHHDNLMGMAAAACPVSLDQRSSDPNLWAWRQVVKVGMGNKKRSIINNDSTGDGRDDDPTTGHGRSHGHGQDDHLHVGVSAVKMKKMKTRRKMREPRFCFKTMSDVDVLDDGYKWRKYGQKVVKNTHHPRSYYRCTQDNCRVKKRVERLAEDPRMVITTYEGRHAHSPSHDHDEDESHRQYRVNSLFW